jgi:hypothetical protein
MPSVTHCGGKLQAAAPFPAASGTCLHMLHQLRSVDRHKNVVVQTKEFEY